MSGFHENRTPLSKSHIYLPNRTFVILDSTFQKTDSTFFCLYHLCSEQTIENTAFDTSGVFYWRSYIRLRRVILLRSYIVLAHNILHCVQFRANIRT